MELRSARKLGKTARKRIRIDSSSSDEMTTSTKKTPASIKSNQRSRISISKMIGPVPDTLPARFHGYTFYDYLETDLRRSDYGMTVSPIYHRLAFLRDIVTWLEQDGFAVDVVRDLFGGPHVCMEPAHVLANALGSEHTTAIGLALEAETRLQSQCDLWKIMRKCLMTASAMRWDNYGPRLASGWNAPETPRSDFCTSRSIVFGNTNEQTARSLLAAYHLGASAPPTPDGLDNVNSNQSVFLFDDKKEREPYTCGLLLDVRTGMMGASMDMLICERDAMGLLRPHSSETELEIYEIKCRAKYLFNPENPLSRIASRYKKLLNTRTLKTFYRFINSIEKPCIEYFLPGSVPSANEALISCHDDWKMPVKTSGRERCYDLDRRHIDLNEAERSRVMLFSEPNRTTRTVSPLTWATGETTLEIQVFANPKHSNFRQVFIQSYVLSGYFPDRKPKPHIVTFFGRERRQDEIGLSFSLSGVIEPWSSNLDLTIRPEQAIPVALIVTPVIVDTDLFEVIERAGLRAFETLSEELWGKINLPECSLADAADEISS
ncbi:deoxyribonuclease [Spheniscid alphaherpesvirus 1]|uniref:Deoxyribonuclease n=1 Tax=Spheniscid alphaherpesvirus 1 TaxID=2560777 RepID=A0A1R3T470_9ALPH|nr:deoxyribonuclease [Spheniscid alphaherpesvirus 1]SCO83587.1 deoxyribonuclease [Spheniscid alphaherpesvirus 1]